MSYSSSKKLLQDKAKAAKSSAIVTTAFQDHISKTLGLNDLISLNTSTRVAIPKSKPVKVEAKSKLDTGLRKSTTTLTSSRKTAEEQEKEYVLEKPKCVELQQTLAEKYGLVPVPKSDLRVDEKDWAEIKEKYQQRGEFKEPCVICKEPLGSQQQQQVLLSCSHTFHRHCLEAFERFSGKKSCPMCRKEKYFTRVVYDASKHYKNLCAAKIQACWRGYLVRKWYRNYRRQVAPQNPLLRQKFFEEKLSDITNRIVNSFNFDTDTLLNDIDANIQKSRETFKNFEEKFKIISDERWTELLSKAVNRCTEECSICMNKYDIPLDCYSTRPSIDHESQAMSSARLELKIKRVVVLSCSHVFHTVCLETFEELNFDKVATCPECRSVYKKKQLFI